MARKGPRAAPVPTPAQLAALVEQRKRAREERAAKPGTQPDREAARRAVAAAPGKTPDRSDRSPVRRYRVCGNKVVHDKKKGECVDLPENAATRALVQAGHLTLVVEVKDQRPSSADAKKGADNG